MTYGIVADCSMAGKLIEGIDADYFLADIKTYMRTVILSKKFSKDERLAWNSSKVRKNNLAL